MRITSAATPIEIAQSVRVVRFPHLLMDVWSNPVQAEIKAGTQPRRQSRQSLQPTPYGSKTTTLKYPCPVAKRTLRRLVDEAKITPSQAVERLAPLPSGPKWAFGKVLREFREKGECRRNSWRTRLVAPRSQSTKPKRECFEP